MRRDERILLPLAAALTLAAACSTLPFIGSEPSPTPPPPPTDTQPAPTEAPTEVPPTAEPERAALPTTPATAALGIGAQATYKVNRETFQPIPFEEDELPLSPGSVEAHWYRSDGRYVVAFIGLDLVATGPLCPGSSVQTAVGFEFVSNAPTHEGACEGFNTLTDDAEVGPRVCGEVVLYVTAIPGDREGILYGTIEGLADEGSAIIGLTSTVESSPEIPEIDLEEVCP